MIIGNTSYSNPIVSCANTPIVSSNYQFVTNIFKGISTDLPSSLQNVGLGGFEAVGITGNIVERVDVLKNKMCDMQSKIDEILSRV